VLQCVAVCCSVCCSVMQCGTVCCSVLQLCCSCVAVVLQCGVDLLDTATLLHPENIFCDTVRRRICSLDVTEWYFLEYGA